MTSIQSACDSFTIKVLAEDSVSEMFTIESDAHSHPWSLSSLKDCFGRLYRVFGIFEESKLLGFAVIQQIVDEVTLLDICVSSDRQGKGLGKQLLNHVLSDAKSHDAVVVMLEVRESNESAKYLYEKVGFVETGRRKNYYPCAIVNADNQQALAAETKVKEDAILMDYRWLS
ncbi:ribosomal protein S18-alanine N-acetyltransferase [Shewanella olleyana]|uniref:ribosomal protein S18-alanine N-acetyltransferase n=1 Tax=Shewanella olleyana TaxID=135626 RepID=UPI00200EDD2D|nr:ribosomal protein S18-alanine N-acetyltransferase [Shewanella olleyana]MCL1065724.1 ribosomal protein S18-alanine N-acetyltransferase [Shewanella olleyana]